MAIDTREKRQSIIAISSYFSGPSVTPNVSKDQEWRQEAGYSYSGILAAAPVIGDIFFGEMILYDYMKGTMSVADYVKADITISEG